MLLTCETPGYCLYRICTVHSFFLKKIVLTLSVICPVGCSGKKESQFLTDAQIKGRASLPQSDLGSLRTMRCMCKWLSWINNISMWLFNRKPGSKERFHAHKSRNKNRASYFQRFWMIECVSDKEKDKGHLFPLPWTPEGINIFWQWGRKCRTLL